MSTARLAYFLNKFHGLERVTPQDLDELSFANKTLIYTSLLTKLNISSLNSLLAERNEQRSVEKRATPEQRKLMEESFARVFLKVVLKELVELSWDPAPTYESFVQKKDEHYRAIEFLLKKIRTANPPAERPSEGERPKTPKKETPKRDTPPSSTQNTARSTSSASSSSSSSSSSSTRQPLPASAKASKLSTSTPTTPSSPASSTPVATPKSTNPPKSSTPQSTATGASSFSTPNSTLTPHALSTTTTTPSSAPVTPHFASSPATPSSVDEKNTTKRSTTRAKSNPRVQEQPIMDIYEIAEAHAAEMDVRDMKVQLKALKQENVSLKKQLQSVKLLYEQLLSEQDVEKVDSRRVNILKAQNIQLERQVLSLSENVQGRQWVFADMQNTINNFLARLTAEEKGKEEKGRAKEKKEPPTPQQLSDWLRTMQSRLQQLQNSSAEAANQQFFFAELRKDPSSDTSAINNSSNGINLSKMTVLDVCKDRATHRLLEDGRISQTENLLFKLYHQLTSLDSALGVIVVPHLLSPLQNHVAKQIHETVLTLRQAIYDLTNLCVLIPQKIPDPPRIDISAHSPLSSTKFTEELVAKMPQVAKTNKAKVETYVSNVVMEFQNQYSILERELTFYRSSHTVQTAYVLKLMKSLKEIYSAFEANIKDRISSPLEMLVNAYRSFAQERSEATLSILLGILKLQEGVFQEVTSQSALITSSVPQDYTHLLAEMMRLIREFKYEYDRLMQEALHSENGHTSLGQMLTSSGLMLTGEDGWAEKSVDTIPWDDIKINKQQQ